MYVSIILILVALLFKVVPTHGYVSQICERKCKTNFDICISSMSDVMANIFSQIVECQRIKDLCKNQCKYPKKECFVNCRMDFSKCFTGEKSTKEVSSCVANQSKICSIKCLVATMVESNKVSNLL